MNRSVDDPETSGAQKCRSSMADRAGRVNCLLANPTATVPVAAKKPLP
jgi:hypothetical protein